MKFTYGSGQKPLDGFTIKRGVGKGGFGEVYFAVSDGGKEVALKLLRGDCGIELRGIAHCINLKHPNLVGVYDLKTDPQGNQWVVMEYVAGEPLHHVLDRHPHGLPVELARTWFLALARAVGYLHDHGIVHRDLKPANIFLEDGFIKVGDYGLCKSMSASQRTPQTQSVGTVHYMAPEISTGNYNKQIDIYACGILLYEMLTGEVPFAGETPGEILMKHLTSNPDLGKLSPGYRALVARALAKDPGQRFRSMAEFAQAVEGLAGAATQPATPPPLPRQPETPMVRAALTNDTASLPMVTAAVQSKRGLLGELSGSLALAALLALLTTVFWAAVVRPDNWRWLGTTYFLTVAVSWAVLVPAKLWRDRPADDAWGRRLTLMSFGALVGIFALWLDGWDLSPAAFGSTGDSLADVRSWRPNRETVATAAGYISYFAFALGLVRWWRMAERRRRVWFSGLPVLAAAFWAVTLLFLLDIGSRSIVSAHGAAAALTAAAAVIQFVSPHDPPPVALPRRLRYRPA